MKPKHKRLLKIASLVFLLGLASTLILRSFKDNLIYFYSPTKLHRVTDISNLQNKKVRVGGLIKVGSINNEDENYSFTITDNRFEININYKGILPPMFREEQGIVAEGILIDLNNFKADKLITKHDENYMPPELKNSIQEEYKSDYIETY